MIVSPCVGCGFCCIQTPCWVAYRVYGEEIGRTCPALVFSNEQSRYLCHLIIDDPNIGIELYAGEGCCSDMNGWRKDVIPRRTKDIYI
jgi:hypothetical protein